MPPVRRDFLCLTFCITSKILPVYVVLVLRQIHCDHSSATAPKTLLSCWYLSFTSMLPVLQGCQVCMFRCHRVGCFTRLLSSKMQCMCLVALSTTTYDALTSTSSRYWLLLADTSSWLHPASHIWLLPGAFFLQGVHMVLKCCQFHVFTGVYFQVVTSSRQLQVFISKYWQLVLQYNFRNFEVLAFTWFCYIVTYSSTYCLPLLTGVISQCCFSVFFIALSGSPVESRLSWNWVAVSIVWLLLRCECSHHHGHPGQVDQLCQDYWVKDQCAQHV